MLICLYLVKASINYARSWIFNVCYLKNHKTSKVTFLDSCQIYFKLLLPKVWCIIYIEFWLNFDIDNFQNSCFLMFKKLRDTKAVKLLFCVYFNLVLKRHWVKFIQVAL